MPAECRNPVLRKAKFGRRSGKVPRSLNSLAPAFHPRRLAARSLREAGPRTAQWKVFPRICPICRIFGDFIAGDGKLAGHSLDTRWTLTGRLLDTYWTVAGHLLDTHVAGRYGVGRWHGGSAVHIFWPVKRQQDKAGIIASTQRRSTCPSIHFLQESLRQ